MHREEEAGKHIWLRYATQFTQTGRTYTVEMSVPVPIGASTEEREQLLREADAGMNQLASHVEERVAQMLKRTQSVRSPNKPTAQSAMSGHEGMVPPTRPTIGASMPLAPVGDSNGSLSLPQFIQHIKDSLGLNPKQAMEILKVKSLSGLNLRDALGELHQLVDGANQDQQHDEAEQPTNESEQVTTDAKPAHETVHEDRPAYFSEESNLDEEGEIEEDADELPYELTEEERVQAKNWIKKLRESGGASTTGLSRLNALTNVMKTQVTEEQLQELVQGIWGVTSLKKLKGDQVDALISWGSKEDDFMSQVEAVLVLLGEEHYARGNR